jgi:carboxypeptidase family protein
MRPLHALIVLALVLVLCGSAYFLLGDRPGAASAVEPSASNAAKPPAPSAAPELARPDASPVAPASADSERVAPEALPVAAPGKVAKAASTLRVRGRVLNQDQLPVAGAQVWAANSEGFAPIPLDADAFERFGWAKRSGAKTDADGRFELEGLKSGVVKVAIRAKGFAPLDKGQIGIPSKLPESGFELEPLILETGVTVAGRVVDSRGRGVAGAKLYRGPDTGGELFFGPFGRAGGVQLGVSEADGTYRVDQLASGPFSLRVTTEDHPDRIETGVTQRPGDVLALNIALEDGFEIRGRIDGAPAADLASLSVRASPGRSSQDGGFAISSFPEMGGGMESREAAPEKDGTFVVRGLREGKTYSLQARRAKSDFFSGSLSPSVPATAGDRGVVLAYQPEAAIVCQVVDAKTLEPLTEFEVEAGIDWPMPMMGEERTVLRTHPEGKVRFGNLRPKSEADRAQLHLSASGYRDYSKEDIALAIGRDTDLGVIALEPVPMIRVSVLDDATGAPVANARVTLSQEQDMPAFGDRRSFSRSVRIGDEGDDYAIQDGQSRTSKTDEQGVASLNSYEGESCRLSVRDSNHARWQGEVFTAPKGESADQTVRLTQGGSVVVTLLEAGGAPQVGGRVEHRSPGEGGEFDFPGRGPQTVTDAQGQIVFAHLAPGAHRFRPYSANEPDGGPMLILRGQESGDSEGWTEVEVTEGGTVTVSLMAPAMVQLSGRVREGGQALAGASLSLSKQRPGGEADDLPAMFRRGPTAKTDGQGNYRFDNVKAGDYTLTVRHPSRHMGSDHDVHVGDDDKRCDIELPVSVIEGRITNEKGEPLAGLRVWAEKPPQGGGPERRRMMSMVISADSDEGGYFVSDGGFQDVKTKTDSEGRYALRGVLADVDLEVKAEGKGVQPGHSEVVHVGADQTRSGVDFHLDDAGSLAVVANNADGSPAKGLLATATFEGESKDRPSPKTEFMQQGQIKLDGLAPGKWRVALRRLGPEEDGATPIPDQVIEVEVGKTSTATFTLR